MNAVDAVLSIGSRCRRARSILGRRRASPGQSLWLSLFFGWSPRPCASVHARLGAWALSLVMGLLWPNALHAEGSATPSSSPQETAPKTSANAASSDDTKVGDAAVAVDASFIAAVRVTLAAAQTGETERLESYVRDVVGKHAVPAVIVDVSRRLERLGRYTRPACTFVAHDDHEAMRVLSCSVERARVIRAVRIESREILALGGPARGLPLALLETDLRKRIFLRSGEPVDDDDVMGRGRIGRQRARIEDFLEREGYFGAQVNIKTIAVGDGPDVDVIVSVRGGSFVRVRRVELGALGPLSQRALLDSYSRMCLTGEGLLDGVFIGNIVSCFNRRRLEATTEKFMGELRKAGYPEARIRVTPTNVDPRARGIGVEDDECTWSRADLTELSAQNLPLPPRCVDLRVDVIPGAAVLTRFHLDRGRIVDDPPLLAGAARWWRETFLEPFSRWLQLTLGAPASTAADTEIIESDLRTQLTFVSAASADEEESRLSLENIRTYLASRGHAESDITMSYRRYDDGSVAVDYFLRDGEVMPVAEVRLSGARVFPPEQVLESVDLASKPRSLANSGFVTARDLEDDVRRLTAWYGEQGFPEANVAVHANRDELGIVHVAFVVDEGPRFLLERVVLEGGDSALTSEVLAVMTHCALRSSFTNGKAPGSGVECRGSPLRPDEFDSDARRIEALYAARGYAPVEASLELGFDDAGKPLVRARVRPVLTRPSTSGPADDDKVLPLRLGEVFIEGNLDTDRNVLLREMGIDRARPGDRLDPAFLSLGVSRLRRTGLFSRVDLELLGIEDLDETAHARVTVEERPSSTVDLSLGFSTQQLSSLRIEAREKNLLGLMFDASAAADLGLFIGRASQVRTQVRWPRMFGTDVSLSFTPAALSYTDAPSGLVSTVPSTPAGQKVGASWLVPDPRRRLLSAGTALSLDWRAAHVHPLIDDKLTVGAAVEARADWLELQGAYLPPFSSKAFERLDGLVDVVEAVRPTPVLSVTPRIAYSNIDNPFDPRSGLGGEVFVRTVPFALAPYAVLGAQARTYRSVLGNRLTFAGGLRLRIGVAGDSGRCNADDDQRCEWALMQNDLLRPGGDRTVRGIDENGIGVVGINYDQSLTPVVVRRVVQTGVRPGVFGAVLNLEARFTLIRQLFLGELRPAFFTDIGVSTDDLTVAWRTLDDVWTDPRLGVSVGAGLRYVLPVGPLSVDVAWSPFRESTKGELPVTVSGALGYIF
jgi:outer membrane protein assembly factor BamA